MASDTPSEPFGTFAEFYPFYMSQHANRTARLLHYVGTALVIGLAIYALLGGGAHWLLALPVAGYGFAWPGHFFFEKNKPATFTYPLWSLFGDFRMFFEGFGGQIDTRRFRTDAAQCGVKVEGRA